GLPAVVTSLGKDYPAVVTEVGATASEGGSDGLGGIVDQILGGAGGGSSNGIDVIVTVTNPDEGLYIGIDADIKIITNSVKGVLTVPIEAVKFAEGKPCVFVYDANKKMITKKDVETGLSEGTRIQIITGLKENDKVARGYDGKTPASVPDAGLKVKDVTSSVAASTTVAATTASR
ncbi:MAG: hypothetical protein FWF08_05290, partial [Oscillospiraceae bacterium]|nr:hypothetical protein [Oscillospiraceae bacterium]